jgi:hypothetical protein
MAAQVGFGCNNYYITCNVTCSIAETTTANWTNFPTDLPTATIEENPIFDGSETMNNNYPNAKHTPSTMIAWNGTPSKVNGDEVCGNCYLYASQTPSYNVTTTSTYTWQDEAQIYCTIAGYFFGASGSGTGTYTNELAFTFVKNTDTACASGEQTAIGKWWWPDTASGTLQSAGAVTVCYYPVQNWCQHEQS